VGLGVVKGEPGLPAPPRRRGLPECGGKPRARERADEDPSQGQLRRERIRREPGQVTRNPVQVPLAPLRQRDPSFDIVEVSVQDVYLVALDCQPGPSIHRVGPRSRLGDLALPPKGSQGTGI